MPHRRQLLSRRPWTAQVGIALCACALAACGASGTSGSTSGTLHLGFVYATTAQNPFQEMALGAKAAAADSKNVDLSESAPSTLDGPKEVSQLRSALRTASDGIAFQTLMPDLFVHPLRQAADMNVPVVAVDTKPPKGTRVPLFVGNSNTELGRRLAKEIVSHIPAGTKGGVVLGNDIPGLTLLRQRLDGVKQVLQKQRPQLKILGPYDSGSKPHDNLVKWGNIVKAHPDAVAYLGAGASDAVSLSLIQKNTGQKFLAGSCDPTPQALQGVKNGYVTALASPEHWLKGYIAVHALVRHARSGKPMPHGWWDTGSLIITSKNIDDIIARQKSPETRKKWFADAVKKQLADPRSHLRPLAEAR